MKPELEPPRAWIKVVGSAALGAAAMYILDPDKGRRRRAIAGDKARSFIANTGNFASIAARDVTYRMQGVRAQARQLFWGGGVPDDLVLIERVRAKMGRVVSHPHAIQIGAHKGQVTLSGPILAGEVQQLLDVVRSVRGVSEVEDHLVVHERPDSIPSLQGNSSRAAMRSEIMQENWTPALRVGAVLSGSLLMLYGMRYRSLTGIALASIGLGLTARGAANVPISRLAEFARGRRAIELQKTIHIAAPPEVVYDMWTHYENFPRFMSHVQEVHELGDGRTHWVVTGPAGSRLEWDAVVTSAIRPQLLSWRTKPGSLVQHAGSVQFEPFDGGTRVSVKMAYDAGGGLGHALAVLLGSDPRRQMDDDLARMKIFIERGALPHDPERPEPAPSPASH